MNSYLKCQVENHEWTDSNDEQGQRVNLLCPNKPRRPWRNLFLAEDLRTPRWGWTSELCCRQAKEEVAPLRLFCGEAELFADALCEPLADQCLVGDGFRSRDLPQRLDLSRIKFY